MRSQDLPDAMAVSRRFFQCYPECSRGALARLFKIRQSAVTEWALQGTVPWNKLKYLSDSQAISWDWLLEGIEPKESKKAPRKPRSAVPKFSIRGINERYFSLFGSMKQIQMAEKLGVTSASLSEWKNNKSRVPWAKLCDAVKDFGVRWDWLLDGLEPKYREERAGQQE